MTRSPGGINGDTPRCSPPTHEEISGEQQKTSAENVRTRRHFLATGFALASGSVAVSQATGTAGSTTTNESNSTNYTGVWQNPGFDAAARGYNHESSVPDQNYTQDWEINLGGIISNEAVADEENVYVPSGGIYAVDRENGDIKWQNDTFTREGLASDDQRVYVDNEDGDLVALDKNSGNKDWSYEFGAGSSTPVVKDGSVVISPLESDGSGALVKLDAETGNEEWYESTSSKRQPIIGNGKVYVSELGNNGNLRAHDLETGDLEWESDDLPVAPAMTKAYHITDDGDEYVLFGRDGNIGAVDASDGTLEWTADEGNVLRPSIWENPDGEDVAIFGDLDGTSAYTLSGSRKEELSGSRQSVLSSVGDNTVLSAGDRLSAVDPTTGNEFYSIDLSNESGVGARPIIIDDEIYATTFDGGLKKFSGDSVNNKVGSGNPEIVVGSSGSPAQSLDDDPLLEDVNGNGEGNVFDALTYYNNRDSQTVEGNPGLFDFDDNGRSGTLFDALQLFNEIK